MKRQPDETRPSRNDNAHANDSLKAVFLARLAIRRDRQTGCIFGGSVCGVREKHRRTEENVVRHGRYIFGQERQTRESRMKSIRKEDKNLKCNYRDSDAPLFHSEGVTALS